jgi:hypothetical protein
MDQVEELPDVSHASCGPNFGVHFRSLLAFVALLSLCGKHYSFQGCSRGTGFLAIMSYKIHNWNTRIGRGSTAGTFATQLPATKRLMEPVA